ncbi:MAG: MauE/DoxX family redox-associated membrane protein [Actinomycetota bacterium]
MHEAVRLFVIGAASAAVGSLLLAGLIKLASPEQSRSTIAQFRSLTGAPLPAWWVVAAVEVVTSALALIGLGTGAVGWVVPACALLAALALLVAKALRGAQSFSCNCFGSASEERASWVTVARNLVLIAIAITGMALRSGATSDAGDLAGAQLEGLLVLGVVLLERSRRSIRTLNQRPFQSA